MKVAEHICRELDESFYREEIDLFEQDFGAILASLENAASQEEYDSLLDIAAVNRYNVQACKAWLAIVSLH
jgi:hypothetical protein